MSPWHLLWIVPATLALGYIGMAIWAIAKWPWGQ